MNINSILLAIAIVWLAGLTYFSFWIYFIFKSLIKIAKDKEFKNNTDEIKKIWNSISDIENKSKFNIQKIGLSKFNPFNEAGGDHSFSLTLLDGNKSGIIITSLHTRERTRVYVKDVSSGKSKVHLSKEEQKSLSDSLK